MGEEVHAKLVEFSENIISLQHSDATYFDHLVKIDAEKLEQYRQIQREFQRMQNELQDLIKEND